jgi:aminoglycoside phosphotransferase family enzyme
VFLAGPDVYKVKRAVKFPFMDLSTLDLRRRACEAEIAVNRANAPSVYLGAPPITRKGHSFAIGGKGEIVEWVVRMRRFDENVGARDPPLPRWRAAARRGALSSRA